MSRSARHARPSKPVAVGAISALPKRWVALAVAFAIAVLYVPAATLTGAIASVNDVTYLVTFDAAATSTDEAAAIAAAGATDVDSIPQLHMHTVSVPGDNETAVVDALNASSAVASVAADHTRVAEGTPDDTAYGDQWALPKIGWDNAYGTVDIPGTAKVAVLDTGIDASNQDLSSNVVAGTSVLDPTSDGTTDPNGHGTTMAGIIAASTNNGQDVAGVAYSGVKVQPVTVLGADGTGQDSDIIAGVVWAADHGADVILMSFSNPGYSPALQSAIDYAWSHGAVVVAATGNDGSATAHFPAGDRGVVGVSNTQQDDSLNPSSNYGDDTFLGAPGTDIVTTAAGGGTTSVTGTSASAAIVAGTAALLKAADSSASNGVIVGRLARNADPAGTAAQTGNGRVNLSRALTDTATDAVKPAGAAPVGSGGPLVGPYVIAAVKGDLEG
ncbi:MAG: thermitase, partial [Actinomycetota bacterium]|nr:thermitase [Actinomycetota bacterium]